MNYLYLMVAFFLVLLLGYLYRGYFILNDITTTPEMPPEYEAAQHLAENQNRNLHYNLQNAAYQKQFYPKVLPLELPRDCSKVFDLIAQEASQMPGWKTIQLNPKRYRIEVVAETSLWHFQDDLVIELRTSSDGCTVHMRSKSRLGKGDFGTNARRIKAFLEKVKSLK